MNESLHRWQHTLQKRKILKERLVSFQKSWIRKHSITWSPPIECIRVKYVSSEITATYWRHRLEVHLFSRSFSCRTPHQFDEKSKQTDWHIQTWTEAWKWNFMMVFVFFFVSLLYSHFFFLMFTVDPFYELGYSPQFCYFACVQNVLNEAWPA